MTKAKPDLSVQLGSLKLKNPLILGSGPCGRVARGLIKYAELGFAAMITKTITPEPVFGNPSPRDVWGGKELLWEASGTPNIGFEAMVEEIRKARDRIKDSAYIVVNLTAEDPDDFARMASGFEKAGAHAIELAIFGCMNYKLGTKIQEGYWERTAERIKMVIKGIKSEVKIPIWLKARWSGIERIKAAEEAGVDVIHRLTSIKTVPINIETGEPLIKSPTRIASCCGPFRKFEAILDVLDLARLVKVPVVGGGGVWTGRDIIEYTMAGATAVQALTSVMLAGPSHVKRMLEELEKHMEEKGYRTLDEIRGITLKHLTPKIFMPVV